MASPPANTSVTPDRFVAECRASQDRLRSTMLSVAQKTFGLTIARTQLIALAKDVASDIHPRLVEFAITARDDYQTVDRIKGHPTITTERRTELGVASSLRRLARTLESTDHVRQSAWDATPRTALNAILKATGHLSITVEVPTSSVLRPILEKTMDYVARCRTSEKAERNSAALAILIGYHRMYSKSPTWSRSPANPTLRFIRKVELCYMGVLPDGLGISRNKKLLQALAARAAAMHPI